MESEKARKIKDLVEKVKTVYVATANKEGIPHIAASEGMTFTDGDRVVFRAWFCLKTIENLYENPRIALSVLDPVTREGYQLLGKMERIEKGAILNGFTPQMEKEWEGFPQVEHQLSIRIEKISHLTTGAHSDEFIR
jgi:uncharacterized protein